MELILKLERIFMTPWFRTTLYPKKKELAELEPPPTLPR